MTQHVYTELIRHYPYIVAWEQMLYNYGHHIEQQVDKAIVDGAPKDSYCFFDGKWQTIDTLTPIVVNAMKEFVKGKRGHLPLG